MTIAELDIKRRDFARARVGVGFAAATLPVVPSETSKLMAELVNRVPDGPVMGDLDAAAAWAVGHVSDTSHLGVTGFRRGARMTRLYVPHNPRVKAAVAGCGRHGGPTNALQTTQPLDANGRLHAPVLGLYSGQGAAIPRTDVERTKAALASGSEAAKRSAFVIDPEAPRADHADNRPSRRKPDADDGWRRCVAWFKTHQAA